MSIRTNIKKAVFARLGGATGAVVPDIADPVPVGDYFSNPTYPYIQIGEMTVDTSGDSLNHRNYNVDFEIMVHDRTDENNSHGFDKIDKIVQYVHERLDRGDNFVIEGAGSLIVRFMASVNDRSDAMESKTQIEMTGTLSFNFNFFTNY